MCMENITNEDIDCKDCPEIVRKECCRISFDAYNNVSSKL